jgi:outer membrane protein OmpA-like peptidoglycan-associated protein
MATEDEVVASKRRKHDVDSANYVGTALPLWAHNLQQALQQQMTAMQQALQQEMQQNVQRITRVILQESQRSINRSRHSNAKRIERVIRVDDGQIPGPHIWFPLNESSLMNATEAQLSDLLGFYNQNPHGAKVERQDRLKEFLGVTL